MSEDDEAYRGKLFSLLGISCFFITSERIQVHLVLF